MEKQKILPDEQFKKCISCQIGHAAEQIIEGALKQLLGEKRITGYKKIDRGGVDFIIHVLKNENGDAPRLVGIQFQVKSSYQHVKQHFSQGGKNPIPVIVLPTNKNSVFRIARSKRGKSKKIGSGPVLPKKAVISAKNKILTLISSHGSPDPQLIF